MFLRFIGPFSVIFTMVARDGIGCSRNLRASRQAEGGGGGLELETGLKLFCENTHPGMEKLSSIIAFPSQMGESRGQKEKVREKSSRKDKKILVE